MAGFAVQPGLAKVAPHAWSDGVCLQVFSVDRTFWSYVKMGNEMLWLEMGESV
jgi:hypothetical protein